MSDTKTTDSKSVPDVKELQVKLTDLAIQLGKHYKVVLDYSVQSIDNVETVLAKISDEYRKTKNEEGIKGMALEMAAYIITVIEKNILKGAWSRDSEEMGKDSFPYELGDGKVIFPYAWCLKRIYDGEGEDIVSKFKTLVSSK